MYFFKSTYKWSHSPLKKLKHKQPKPSVANVRFDRMTCGINFNLPFNLNNTIFKNSAVLRYAVYPLPHGCSANLDSLVDG